MVAGIPTTYRYNAMRSRLEARWASFFDLIRWPWTYEPLDADGYIPDFLIHGKAPLFVEVGPCMTVDEYQAKSSKPFAAFPPDELTCNRERRHVELGETCDCSSFGFRPTRMAMVVGVTPAFGEMGGAALAGLLNDNGDGDGECLTCGPEWLRIGVNWDGRSHVCRYWPCGHISKTDVTGIVDSRLIEDLWAQAGSRVQWKAAAG